MKQGGFTLIELVVVIMILGILAATAVPKFMDLSDEAEEATAQATAGALASATAINYAGCAATGFKVGTKCVAVKTCASAGTLIDPAPGADASKFSTLSDATLTGTPANGDTFACEVASKRKSSIKATAKVTYADASS